MREILCYAFVRALFCINCVFSFLSSKYGHCLGFGVWNAVSDALSVFLLTSAPEKSAFTNHVVGCVWKWIRPREQNSAPESRHVSLYSVKVIKMSRQTINRFLILWALYGSLRCCETHCETDCTTLLSLETQDIERGQLWWARKYARNPCIFKLRLSVRVITSEFFWSDRKHANRPIMYFLLIENASNVFNKRISATGNNF